MKTNSIQLMILASVLYAATANAQSIDANILPQLGTVQQQDMDSLKRLQAEERGRRDYQNLKNDQAQKAKADSAPQKTAKRVKTKNSKKDGVFIEKFEIEKSEILSEAEIQSVIAEYEQSDVTIEDLTELIDKINDIYLEKGYVTARAYLPEQTVEKGVIKIALMEGKVGDITVSGNRWTKASHIKKRLGIEEGALLNMQKLEENMLIYNRYNENISIKGGLEAGKKTGTTDVEIATEEQAPYHLTAVTDNAGRSTIGKQRAGLIAQHDSLLGYRDKLVAGMYANRYSLTPFVDYSVPVTSSDGRLGVSFSNNKAEIGRGAYKDFNIVSRSQVYTLYYTQPILRKTYMELSNTSSFAYKNASTSFDGFKIYEDKIPEFKTGLNFRYDTEQGIWYVSQNVSYAAPLFQKSIDYWKFEGSALRLHDFGHRFLGQFRGNYQYIPEKIIPSADQMSAGGFGTVRGYSQGLSTAKSGYQLNAEIYFPLAPDRFCIDGKSYRTDEYVRPFAFVDYAALYPYKGRGLGKESINKNDILLSTGLGLRIQLPYNIVLKTAYGYPLRESRYEKRRGGDWTFELSFSPDFNKFFTKAP